MFKLSEKFLEKYKDEKSPFGIIGEVTYKRTYSRPVEDEQGNVVGHESWVDTIRRVVEGNVNLGIKNGDPTATNEWAEKAFDFMFKMAVMPPGRGYWMMGTKYAEMRGGDALNNCWYVAVRPQSYENIEMFKNTYLFSSPDKEMVSFPFVFMFDRAMLGGGVGFGVGRENIEKIPEVTTTVGVLVYLHHKHPDWSRIKQSEEYARLEPFLTDDESVVQNYVDTGAEYLFPTDDREGWNVSIRETIDSHFDYEKEGVTERSLVIDLSTIRGYGARIKGFGGTASGPLPLISAIVEINNIFNSRVGGNLKSDDGLDIMNMLGRCVVAGNVRRSALIALGDADDKTYVDAKNYKIAAQVIEKDEYGFPKWDTNEFGRMSQVRRDRTEVVFELVEEAIKENPEISNEEAVDIAERKADELYDLAWKQENHRWTSNNSVYTDELFDDHHFIAAGIIANGEPGVGNMWLMKNFGRIVDGYKEAIDGDAEGLNPCAK